MKKYLLLVCVLFSQAVFADDDIQFFPSSIVPAAVLNGEYFGVGEPKTNADQSVTQSTYFVTLNDNKVSAVIRKYAVVRDNPNTPALLLNLIGTSTVGATCKADFGGEAVPAGMKIHGYAATCTSTRSTFTNINFWNYEISGTPVRYQLEMQFQDGPVNDSAFVYAIYLNKINR